MSSSLDTSPGVGVQASPASSPLVSRRRRRRRQAGADGGAIRHGRLSPYLFSAPAVFTVAAILAFPVLYGVVQSLFRAKSIGMPTNFVGLLNYTDMFADPEFWRSLRITAVFVLGCLIVNTVLGVAFAFALHRALGAVRFLRAVTIAPYIVSSVAAAVMFRILFNGDFGLLNRMIEFFGFGGLPWLTNEHLAMLVVVFCQVWTDVPLTILLVLAGLQSIDQSYMDAALVDGATGWKRARFVSLPLVAPQIAISIVWESYSTLTGLGVILALTGGGPLKATYTLPMNMYATAFTSLEMNQALAIGTFILVLNAVLTMMFIAVSRRFGTED